MVLEIDRSLSSTNFNRMNASSRPDIALGANDTEASGSHKSGSPGSSWHVRRPLGRTMVRQGTAGKTHREQSDMLGIIYSNGSNLCASLWHKNTKNE